MCRGLLTCSQFLRHCNTFINEKALRETQTLHARRSPPIDAQSPGWLFVRQSQNSPPPAAVPLPGGAGPPKFNQLEVVTTGPQNPT